MKLLVFFFLYTSLAFTSTYSEQAISSRGAPGTRIIGGQTARASEFPFSVAITSHTSNGQYFCGGALIDRSWFLTAARCADGAILFTIILGASNLQDINEPSRVTIATEEYWLHPAYDPLTLENDIALIKSRLPIDYSDYIQPISLPSAPLADHSVVVAIGWGQISDEDAGQVSNLNRVTITVLTNEECRLTYGNAIFDSMVCAEGNYNEGTCYGDSGSPLVQYILNQPPTHVGVASFFSINGCESTDPSGFTRTELFVDWINNVTSSN